MNAHSKTHNNASFTCDIFKEIIKDSSYFKNHVRSHTGTRPHECPVCVTGMSCRSYIQKSHLNVHMSIHFDHKPFLYDMCDKSLRLAKGYK
jgi:KRAB domain-containing zinc finger protein